MNYHVKCLKCGAKWWCEGDYESDTNVPVLDDSKVYEDQCSCGDALEIIDEESIEFEDNYF